MAGCNITAVIIIHHRRPRTGICCTVVCCIYKYIPDAGALGWERIGNHRPGVPLSCAGIWYLVSGISIYTVERRSTEPQMPACGRSERVLRRSVASSNHILPRHHHNKEMMHSRCTIDHRSTTTTSSSFDVLKIAALSNNG